MKAHALLRISGMTLVAIAVTLIVLALVYTLQNAYVSAMFTTISWNS